MIGLDHVMIERVLVDMYLRVKCSSLDFKEARDNIFIIFKRRIYFSIVCNTTGYLKEKKYGRIELYTIKLDSDLL